MLRVGGKDMILNANPNEHMSKVTKILVVVVFISWLVPFMGGCGVYTHRFSSDQF